MKRFIGASVIALTLAACGGAANDGSSKDGGTRPVGGGSPSPATAGAVEIAMFTYTPAEVAVKPGTTVTWTNTDQILHTVTAGGGPDDVRGDFDGQLPDAGATFEFTFDKPGRYEYFCTRHPGVPGMHGIVVVAA